MKDSETDRWGPPPMMGRIIDEQTLSADALLLGRRKYQIFAAHWPRVTDPNDPVASTLNNVRKYVASRTLHRVEWHNSSLIPGDVAAGVKRLKDQPGGDIQVHGSSNLIQTLLKHDLIDEFRLWTFPIVLGSGKRLFGDGTIPAAFRLVDNKVSTTGVVVQRYERAGKIEYGSFALGEDRSSRDLWSGKS